MTVIAIDPGVTTGVAVRLPDKAIQTCVIEDPNELWDLIRQTKAGAVVYEMFEPRAARISKYGLHTVRLCGGIEAVCHLLKLKPVKHMPFHRTPFQKQAGALLKGRGVRIHEEDALAHLLAYEHWSKK